MELCRRILSDLEDEKFGTGLIKVEYEDVEQDTIAYHLKLLDEVGLIEAVDISKMDRLRWRVKSITWEGHDFLEGIKDEGNWNKVKKYLKDGGKIITIETLKAGVNVLFT